MRTAKIALPIFASLAGFVFLPFEAAIAMSAVVTIGALFFGGCLDCKSIKKIFKPSGSNLQSRGNEPVDPLVGGRRPPVPVAVQSGGWFSGFSFGPSLSQMPQVRPVASGPVAPRPPRGPQEREQVDNVAPQQSFQAGQGRPALPRPASSSWQVNPMRAPSLPQIPREREGVKD
jgi:hypothetical protein